MNAQVAHVVRKIDDVGQAVLPIAPKVGFTARQVEHAHAFVMVSLERRFDLVHAHDVFVDIRDTAAEAVQVAGVVGDQAEDVGPVAV